jgi:hypothetical protein
VTTVKKWLKAWSSKEMDAYGSFYAASFVSDGMNRREWIERKKTLAAKYKVITVTGENFKVQEGRDKSVVTFLQSYQSSGFKSSGVKTLELVKEGGGWKICREKSQAN